MCACTGVYISTSSGCIAGIYLLIRPSVRAIEEDEWTLHPIPAALTDASFKGGC